MTTGGVATEQVEVAVSVEVIEEYCVGDIGGKNLREFDEGTVSVADPDAIEAVTARHQVEDPVSVDIASGEGIGDVSRDRSGKLLQLKVLR